MYLNFDYLVVGSGATGAIAAKTLVEKGVQVALLDIGSEDDVYKNLIPNKDFLSIRKEDNNQDRYFLGDQFEGIPWKTTRVGSQLTPPRNFLTRFSEVFFPFNSDSFQPLESTAKGGLGGGWGLGSYVFSELELEAVGLNASEMNSAYQSIISYIGVSGANDDGALYGIGDLKDIQSPMKLDANHRKILNVYLKNKSKLNKRDIYIGKSVLALLTKDKGDRKAVQYRDMGFWSDTNKSAYRSWMTIDELLKKSNFSYHRNCLVTSFEEFDGGVRVFVKRVDTNEIQIFTCKKLILSSGVLGTARIVSRSFDYKKEKLPILCNPYSYTPCVNRRQLGKNVDDRQTSFAQLVMYLDEYKNNFDVGVAALFSYRSLLLFKLIKETPLNFVDARILMQFMQSSFTIAGIHHPEKGSKNKYISLIKDTSTYTGDILSGEYILSEEEQRKNADREKKFKRALKSLGCYPLKTIQTPAGASIHYGGTLPFSETNELFTVHSNGKLGGTKNVYIADGSGFKYLPAKGVTLTLMANAYRVAKNVLKNE